MRAMDWLSSPALVRTAAASMGLTAARLDYHQPSNTLYLSLAIRGKVHQVPLPIGQTFTRDQIIERLFADPPAAPVATGAAEISASPP